MPFDTLSPEIQNILLVNHSYISKWFVFVFIIILSCYYIWYIWPNHKPTIYFTQAIMRVFFYCLAVSTLLASPLMIMNMSPELSFLEWYSLPLMLYKIFTSILFVVLFIDLVSLGIFWILAQAGLDVSNGRVNDIKISWENNKHFLKIKKNGGKSFGRR